MADTLHEVDAAAVVVGSTHGIPKAVVVGLSLDTVVASEVESNCCSQN